MPDESKELHKTTIPLPAGHGWKCKEGNSLFVADRGACAFEIPGEWVIRHDGKQTVSIHDLPPPADSCRIALTIFHLPPIRGGWGQLPLSSMLEAADKMRPEKKTGKKSKGQKSGRQSPVIHTEPRPDIELVWTDRGSWPDPENGKPISCRQILARGRLVQVLITFDVYEDHKARCEPAWNDLLQTLKVAVPRDLAGNVTN